MFSQEDLVEFANGSIAKVFGPEYGIIDTYSRRVMLPTYPFQRQRYWVETARRRDPSPSNSSQVMELLSQGNIPQLTQLLAQDGQLAIDTGMLERLVKIHQQQLASVSLQDLIYEVTWIASDFPSPGSTGFHLRAEI